MNKIDQRHARFGYLYVALAAILFAISGTSAKFLFNDGITAFQLIQMRTTLAFAGLMLWLCLRHPVLLKISLKDLTYFIGLGVFGIGSAQFFYLLEAFLHRYSPVQWGLILFIGIGGTIFPFGLYFEGIRRIQPTHASITATLEPISAGIFAAVFMV